MTREEFLNLKPGDVIETLALVNKVKVRTGVYAIVHSHTKVGIRVKFNKRTDLALINNENRITFAPGTRR